MLLFANVLGTSIVGVCFTHRFQPKYEFATYSTKSWIQPCKLWTVGRWGPDWCNAQVHLDADRGTLWTTCQDNGLLMLKFTNGAWPFPQSKTPAGEQN